MIDFSIIPKSIPYLLRGTVVTLEIATISSIIGFILGILLAFMQRGKSLLLKFFVEGYVTLFRGTPMLIQITFMSIILPAFLGISLLTTAIIAIGLNSAAYISQIIRSGISSVGLGQMESAKVLGLTPLQTMRYIIFPQAIRTVVPSLLNELITLIKDSSLASIIGVTELFKEGTNIISRTYNAIPIYFAVAALYLILTTSLSILVNYLDRKWNKHALN